MRILQSEFQYQEYQILALDGKSTKRGFINQDDGFSSKHFIQSFLNVFPLAVFCSV